MLRPPLLVGGREYMPVSPLYTVLVPAAVPATLLARSMGLGTELTSRSTGCRSPACSNNNVTARSINTGVATVTPILNLNINNLTK